MRRGLPLILLGVLATGCLANELVAGHETVRDGGSTPALTDAAFMCSPEVCAVDPGHACGILPACGCSCDSTCRPNSGSTRACTLAGPGLEGAPCGEHRDCGHGLRCMRQSGEALGTCEPFCYTDTDCALGRCMEIEFQMLGGVVSDVGSCSWSCNPVTGGGCPAPLVCRQAVGNSFTFDGARKAHDICTSAGSARENEPCTQTTDCAGGLQCVDPAFRCHQICRRRDQCGGRPCLTFADPTDDLEWDVGYCGIECDVLSGGGCSAGTTCKLNPFFTVDGPRQFYSHCLPEGAAGAGEPCVVHQECSAGHICVDDQCVLLCELPGGSCPTGTTCAAPIPPVLFVGAQEYGFCS